MRDRQTTTRRRLTKTTVETLPPSKSPYWDSELTGFGVRVSGQGTRSYFVQKRLPNGLMVKPTIGRHGDWTAERARQRAKVLLGQIAAGIDPTSERRAARQAERKRIEAPTVQALLERYMIEHASRRKRQRSVETDRSLIHKHLLPALGRRRVADVTHDDVERLHAQISLTAPIAANRAVALLSKAMSLAIKWEMRADNPCRGLERNPEEGRERYLTGPEMARLAAALNRRQDDLAAACIVFLLLTGARRGETLQTRWRNFVDGTWYKPSAHTKQRKIHRVPLSPEALAVLATIAERFGAHPEDHVFGPGLIHKLRSCWEAVRDEAELPGLRLHDLRHSFASVLVSRGEGLPVIGRLLGHTTPQTTAGYAHLFDDPLRQATARVGSLWTELSNGSSGELPPPHGGQT